MTKASGAIDLKSLKVAGENATGYITDITNNGIKVASATASNLNYVTIDATGMEIFKSNGASTASALSVAKFGETTRIGEEGGSHLLLDYHSLKLEVPSTLSTEYSDNTYFRVLDLRDKTGKYEITDETLVFKGSSSAIWGWHFRFPVDTSYSLIIKLDDRTLSSSEYTFHSRDETDFVYIPSGGSSIEECETHTVKASYTTTSPYAITLMFGWRDMEDTEIGPTSIALGPHVTASGKFSASIGLESRAQGFAAIAMGNGQASGDYSFAVMSGSATGESSVAIGKQANVYGDDSYAIGRNVYANNYDTFLFGRGLESNAPGQFIFGEYNSPSTDDFLEIGLPSANGTTRQNALTIDWDGNIMAPKMAGQIIMFAGSTAPNGWLICDGSAVSRTTYATLFAVIGTTYGSGNGSTTFNLPDFRGRVGVGVGTGTATGATAHTLNQKAGEETHVLTPAETAMKAHDHGIEYNVVYRTTASSGGGVRNVVSGGSSTTSTLSTTAANGSAHNNMPPYIGINYIICTGKTY